MTKSNPRCQALLARQEALYLAMRRTKAHLFDWKHYQPASAHLAPLKQEEIPSNVQPIRRKAK